MIKEFFINGELKHYTKSRYDIIAPHDGSVIASIPDATIEDVNAAVAAAKHAYDHGWKTMEAGKRTRLLLRWADLVEAMGSEIAALDGLETGRATKGGSMEFFADYIRYFAGWVNNLYGDVIVHNPTHLNYVVQEPLGVVASMPAWNTVASGAIQKMAPALAAGNTIVLRAPDEAPLSCMYLAKTIIEAGFPDGVVNIIAGNGPAISKALVNHRDVALISFTGSVEVGKAIQSSASKTLKRTVMELGGKSPYLIFEDADIDRAVSTLVDSAFSFQGQSCSAPSRVLVQRSILNRVLSLMKELTERYQPAFPDDPSDAPRIGPLFSKKQYERIVTYVERGKEEGTLIIGGNRVENPKYQGGYYFNPSIFIFDGMGSRVTDEEIFGPIVAVIPFDTIEDAISIANDVPYGLAAGVWSRSVETLLRCSKEIVAGTIWENCYYQYTILSPWGGFKESGMGREFGMYALVPYLDYKSIWMFR